jgi:hypothetical protein
MRTEKGRLNRSQVIRNRVGSHSTGYLRHPKTGEHPHHLFEIFIRCLKGGRKQYILLLLLLVILSLLAGCTSCHRAIYPRHRLGAGPSEDGLQVSLRRRNRRRPTISLAVAQSRRWPNNASVISVSGK